MLNILWLVLGLGLLIAGGDLLIRGAVALATRLGISPVIVGLTVVAFGTSTPELVVNLAAAWRGDSSIGFGNVVGSNIANIGLLLGLTALLFPLAVHRSIATRETPMLLLACGAGLALGLDHFFATGPDHFTRGDGVVLLLLFGVFLYYTFADALQQREADPFVRETASAAAPAIGMSTARIAGFIAAGLLLLVAGGELTVRGAVGFATALRIPQVVIGLTIVAVGTSLPELATTFIAARRGQTDLAIGNIVGSNIYNLLFIWGLTVTVAPTRIPAGGGIDMLVMTAFAVVLLPMAITQQRLSRLEGAVLLAGYGGYITWLAMR